MVWALKLRRTLEILFLPHTQSNYYQLTLSVSLEEFLLNIIRGLIIYIKDYVGTLVAIHQLFL